MRALKLILQIALPCLIVFLAANYVKRLKASKEPPKSRKPTIVIPQAEFTSVSPGNYAPPVQSFGTVEAYEETTLVAQVNSEIISISDNFREGLRVKQGDTLVRLKDIDIRAQLQTAKANVIIAESTLEEERVRAQQAAEDWIASGRNLETASRFVLRKPQISSAEASLTSSIAAVTQVEENLNNTIIRAPYDALVLERSVSLGDFATATTIIGRLVSLDKAQVRLPLTAAQMDTWSRLEDKSPSVTLTAPSIKGAEWPATITRSAPIIDSQNQVSYVIAEVDDPYSHSIPLTIGTFVNVNIPSPALTDTYELNEVALVNESFVWGLDEEDKLFRIEANKQGSFKDRNYLKLNLGDQKPPIRIVNRPLTTFRSGQVVKPVKINTQ